MNATYIKDAVRQRDGYRCAECGMSDEEHRRIYNRALDVHRVVPGSEYTVEGCITVCRRCHGPMPRRPRGTCSTNSKVRNLNVWLPPDLMKGFQAYRETTRRTKTMDVAIILEEYLASKGFWPPEQR